MTAFLPYLFGMGIAAVLGWIGYNSYQTKKRTISFAVENKFPVSTMLAAGNNNYFLFDDQGARLGFVTVSGERIIPYDELTEWNIEEKVNQNTKTTILHLKVADVYQPLYTFQVANGMMHKIDALFRAHFRDRLK